MKWIPHLTGFDSGAHRMSVSKYAAGNEAVEMLITWYERRTADLAPAEAIPWRLGFYTGNDPIAPQHREIYRKRPDLHAAFPDPYRVPAIGSSLMKWMKHTAPVEHPECFSADES